MRHDTDQTDRYADSPATRWFGLLAETYRNWRDRASQRREFDELARSGELDRVLADVGITQDQLPTVMGAHPDSPKLRAQMMKRLGVDAARLRLDRGEFRDIEWRCMQCDAVPQCREWLATPATGDAALPGFCPNVGTFATVRDRQDAAAQG